MKRIVLLLLMILPLTSFGQLITSTAQSPAGLVQNVLLGSGVTVSNITYNGHPAAIGEFNGTSTNIGLNDGIIITTGTVLNQGTDGPHGPNNVADGGMDNGTPGNALLTNLVGGTTFNASVLEFDFVPYSDSVKFNYVFGSEEYEEYVGSQFNDVFAFFIIGPGYPTPTNIALLPNNQPVAINNVHDAVSNQFGTFGAANAQYYVDNTNGATIQYDGFTEVLTAKAEVQCGQTYRLIIAIADTGDGIYDSGIFLEANSLSSDTPIEVDYTLSQELFGAPNIMGEGCVSATVTLDRDPAQSASPMTVPINVSGTATEGVDYSNIPNSVTFAAGQSSVSFTIDAFQDALVEGQESITIEFPITDPCGNVTPIILELAINDIEPVEVEIDGGTINCPGEQVTLTAVPSGGASPYTFLWNTGETTPSITVTPGATTTYSVTVEDACLGDQATDSYEVVVPVLPPLVLNETPDITEICPYLPTTLAANASGGSGNYSYTWSTANDPNLGNGPTLDVIPSTSTTYFITVSDDCGNSASAEVVYTITSPPLVLDISPGLEICPSDSAFIEVFPTGGYGQYYYLWPHSGETTSGVWVNPSETTTYQVIVSDECQTFTVDTTTTVTVVAPTADFTVTSTVFFNNLPITFENQSQNATSYIWDFGNGSGDTFPHPSTTYPDPGMYNVTLIAIDDKGCTDTITKPINIEEEWYVYIPNTFTPDGDRYNNDWSISTVGVKSLEVNVFNRWGEIIFTSNDLNFEWDGTYLGLYVPDGTYTYDVNFVTNSGRDRNLRGHVNVLK
ncbi:MAG: choice-of-anchor L domain-containing protein [bacterium]|nr:choice-of-anchor L domain-containing protein [bacterium]